MGKRKEYGFKIKNNNFSCLRTCALCLKAIQGDKYLLQGRSSSHIICYFNWIDRRFEALREKLKYLRKYKAYMMIERLNEEKDKTL